MKTPNSTSSKATTVRLRVRPGSRSIMNGTRLPNVYCSTNMLMKSFPYMTDRKISQDFIAV